MKIIQTFTAFMAMTLLFIAPISAFGCEPNCVEETTEDWFDFSQDTSTDVISAAEGTDFAESSTNSASGGGMNLDTGGGINGDIWGTAGFHNLAQSSDDEGNGSFAAVAGRMSLGGQYEAHVHGPGCGHDASGFVEMSGATDAMSASMGDLTSAEAASGGSASFGQQVGGPTHAQMHEWANASASGHSITEGGGPAVSGSATLTSIEGLLEAGTYTRESGDGGE